MGQNCCVSSQSKNYDALQEIDGDRPVSRETYTRSLQSSTLYETRDSTALMSNSGATSRDSDYFSDKIGIEDFTIVRVVGRGSFGKVYLVTKKSDGKVYAMKTLKKDMILRKNQTENTRSNKQIHIN